MSGLLIKVRCHYCSKGLPAWRTHQLTEAQRICDYCLEWHGKAIELLAGRALPGCQVCRATPEFLRDSTPGVEVRMYVVPKDGIYQVLCHTCYRSYAVQRADLYHGTLFGTTDLKL